VDEKPSRRKVFAGATGENRESFKISVSLPLLKIHRVPSFFNPREPRPESDKLTAKVMIQTSTGTAVFLVNDKLP
jgi:hypothetical protein